MEQELIFRIGKKLEDKSELVVGKYYLFYNDVYLYCGSIAPFENAHAFGCQVGTLYMNNAQLDELFKNKEIKHATRKKTE